MPELTWSAPDQKELVRRYNDACILFYNKIQAAYQDIHETRLLRVRSYFPPEMLMRHLDIMREYIRELEQQREDMRQEFKIDLDRSKEKQP